MSNELPEGAVPLAESLNVGQQKVDSKPTYKPAGPITIELPNGTRIDMERPKSVSVALAGLTADIQANNPIVQEIERQRALCLLHITAVNGEDQPRIMDPIMRAALEEKIGIEFLDAIFQTWMDEFPPCQASQLKVVKKS